MNINENQWKSMKINEHQQTPIKIYENQCTSMHRSFSWSFGSSRDAGYDDDSDGNDKFSMIITRRRNVYVSVVSCLVSAVSECNPCSKK